MRYAEFRDRLEDALHEAGIFFHRGDRRVETIELADSVRRWEAPVWRDAPPSADPFQLSAVIGFEWGPVNAARAYTCEEDLLTELVGRRRPIRTERRRTRVDLSLHASLPYGSTTPMPEPHVFGAWTATALEKADIAFTDIEEKGGRLVAVLGGHGDLEVHAHCHADGLVSLTAVAISGFQMVRVPRVWDSPERRDAERGRDTSSVDWRGGSRSRSMSGRRVSRRSRRGSGTRRHHRERSRSRPASTINSRTMMTAGRTRRTDWPVLHAAR